MAKPNRRRLDALALRVCEAVVELTRHRTGRGEQWVMLASVQKRLGLSDADLEAAVALAVEREALMAEGDPVHSVAVHRRLLRATADTSLWCRGNASPIEIRGRLACRRG